MFRRHRSIIASVAASYIFFIHNKFSHQFACFAPTAIWQYAQHNPQPPLSSVPLKILTTEMKVKWVGTGTFLKNGINRLELQLKINWRTSFFFENWSQVGAF
jgi:hypothetical protein